MAVRFDLKKFETIKRAYLEYLWEGKIDKDMLQKFAAYKPYLDTDAEVQDLRKKIKSLKDAEKRRAGELKHKEEKLHIKETRKTATKKAKADKETNIAAINTNKRVLKNEGPRIAKPYIGRVNNMARKALSISTKAEANALFYMIINLRPALSVNELDSTIELCKHIKDEDLSRYLIGLFTPRLRNAQELVDRNTKKYIDQLHKKPTNPEFVRIIPIPMGGLNKRY